MKKAIAIIAVLVLCLSLSTVAFAAEANYYLVGTSGLCNGEEWNVNADINKMTLSGSIYTITVNNVPAGKHEFKVSNGSWDAAWPSSNYVLETTKTASITVNFDPSTSEISVLIDGVPMGEFYIVAGDSGLCNGVNWGQADQTNRMTLSGDVYTITFEDILPGAYGFKVVKNGDWNQAWPPSNYNITVDAVSDVTITYNPATNEVNATIKATGEVVEIINKYVVAGDEALTGENWNPTSENTMTEKDGVYEITYKDVAAGTYGFKVVKNGSWASSWPGDNYSITLENKSDVTIAFDPATNEISVSIVSGGVAVPDKYVVAGSSGLCGSEWASADEANLMTEISDGVYAITYQNVAAGDYELKVVMNGGTWIGDSDGNNVKITVSEACNVTVTYSAANGIVVTGDHVGPTVITPPTTDNTTNNTTGTTPSTAPTTGDSTNLFAVTAAMILSATALVILKKKEF